MWVWGIGGLVTVGGTMLLLAGGPSPTRAADATIRVAPQPPPPAVRFDEPPLAKAFRARPPAVRLSAPSDPF